MGANRSCCIGEDEDKLLVTKIDLSHCGCMEVPNIVFNSERCIENLILSCNQITSLPPQLFHCQELKHLNLSDNYLESIPEAVGSLYNLVSLKLDKNNIYNLPESLKKCRRLKRLSLNNNSVKNLLHVITKIINLQEAYLNNCDIKYLTASIGRLSKLKIIEMRNNSLCSLPLSFSRLQSLTRLDIGDNEFSEFPKCITNLHSLTELYLDNNYIEEIINIEELKQLHHMDLSFNNIVTIHEGIGYCSQLNMLNLSHNYIETIPDTIQHMKQLQYLNLESNDINVLTQSIGKLNNVLDINLSTNQMNSLPATIGLLRNLKYFNISNNLVEELPNEIGSCNSMTILNLSYNRIQLLPSEIGYMSSLVVLNLIGNLLTYLPMSVNNLRSIKAIWLSSNQNVPLIPFVQDTHGLTNITLPQVGETYNNDSLYSKNCTWQNIERKIRFAEDDDSLPGKLHRTPTPFPKELRAPYKKQQKQETSTKGNNDNYVNVVDGRVCEDEDNEEHLVNETPLQTIQGSSSVIREANIRKSNDGNTGAGETVKLLADEADGSAAVVPVDDVMKQNQESAEVLPKLANSRETAGSNNQQLMEQYEASLINELKLEKNSFQQRLEYFEMRSHGDNTSLNEDTSSGVNNNVVDTRVSDGGVPPDETYPLASSNINNFVYKNVCNTYDPHLVRQMYHNDIIVEAPVLPADHAAQNHNLYQNTNEMKYNDATYPVVFENGTSFEETSLNVTRSQLSGYKIKPPPPKIYETQPPHPSRPDSKQSMNSLTEEMRRRNISPPCYEIAKMYSTKAALFEQDRV